MYDVIIIGAGPAGLTASIYGERANLKVLVLEANTYGGQIVNASNIENYPAIKSISGFDFATALYNQALELGAEIKFEKVNKIEVDNNKKIVVTDSNKYEANNVIIATGAANRKLGIDNEQKLTGRGISYCATCDGSFYKNKDVAIVGGGNTAFTDAIYLSNIANKVYLIHRSEKFKSEEKYVEELKSKTNVEFILNAEVKKLNGDNKLESIDIKNNITNEIRNLKIDGLFVAVGQSPSSDIAFGLLDINSKGYIVSNDTFTNVPGIYVIGDVRTKKVRQLTTATSDGTIAIMNILEK